ncbi:MAG: hypothetical protein M3680_01945 [Myxococcota bacterium]|nr:hypothetical protein [Myxococcota bacterium]
MTRGLGALVLVAALATAARADADAAFRAAVQRAAVGDAGAIEAFEALGQARPVSRWTDDAWVEAARLAERRGDYDRARADLAAAIAIGTDPQLVRRAQGDLARLTALTGGAGEWSTVAAEHQRLVTDAASGDDPRDALRALEALARAHPTYPRGVGIRLTLATAWEAEDELARALGWLRDAISISDGADRERVHRVLVRTLIRNRLLGEARRELARVVDSAARRSLTRELATAERRGQLRWVIAAALAVLLGLAGLALRCRTGSWRAAARALVRPPIEVLYLAPIGVVVGAIATTGNPLVARAVIHIVLAGAVIAWLSGATLEAARRRGPLARRHALLHGLVVGVAVLATVYLIIDHARLLDLVTETWRTGPASR